MHADTKRNASREKRVSMISPTTVALVAIGAKKINACVEMTAACLIGRIASMWSSRLRVPAGGVETVVTRDVAISLFDGPDGHPRDPPSLQTLSHDHDDVVTEQFALLNLPGGVRGQLGDDGQGDRTARAHEGRGEFFADLDRQVVNLFERRGRRDVLQLDKGNGNLA